MLARKRVLESDFPPEYNFTEPLENDIFGQPVTGPGEEPVDATEKTLDRDRFISMLKEYYRLREWDKETGLPRAETLEAVGLDDVVPKLRRQ